MKHFLIIITYTASLEKIDQLLSGHREFLQTGYDKGLLLMSGPRTPRSGGIVIARAKSREEIEEFFRIDPYKTNKLAEYDFIEFNPVKHQEFLNDWISKDKD
jgi:uncharacterized protein YciI